jgi:mannose-6-phosphate isomerase-like protein (cupin superfamily)
MAVSGDFGELGRHSELREGRLVCTFHLTSDWKDWEMHPEGDEILYLMSGALDLILEDGKGERVVELRPGAACIIPRGTWHRANVRRLSKGLFITPGKGTQYRPV